PHPIAIRWQPRGAQHLSRDEVRQIAAKQPPTLRCARMSRQRSLALIPPTIADALVATWLTRLPVSDLPGPQATIAESGPGRLPAAHARMRSEVAPDSSDRGRTIPYLFFAALRAAVSR